MSEFDEHPRLQRALAVIALRMGLKATAEPHDVVRAVVRMADDNTGLRQALAEAREVLRNREAELAELEQAHRWIPVSERLPDEGTTVLAHSTHRGVMMADYRMDIVRPAFFGHGYAPGVVTHWRPLPKGPEGGGE